MQTQSQQSSARFPLVHCDSCAKSVVASISIDDAGREVRVCAHCDAPIAHEIEWLDADELEASGYYIGAPPAPPSCSTGGGCSVKRH
jgi:hypothetical protein